MGKIFYTADLHFGHANIIEYENRPFKDIDEMTYELIKRWNSKVGKNDDVYVLGDFAFQGQKLPIDNINDIVKQLNGKKHLIVGNHDHWVKKIDFKPKLWESIDYYLQIKDEGRIVILCHYPIESWDRQEYGAIHLHGHLHSNPTRIPQFNRCNVGCDNWNYYPVTLNEIMEKNKNIRGEV